MAFNPDDLGAALSFVGGLPIPGAQAFAVIGGAIAQLGDGPDRDLVQNPFHNSDPHARYGFLWGIRRFEANRLAYFARWRWKGAPSSYRPLREVHTAASFFGARTPIETLEEGAHEFLLAARLWREFGRRQFLHQLIAGKGFVLPSSDDPRELDWKPGRPYVALVLDRTDSGAHAGGIKASALYDSFFGGLVVQRGAVLEFIAKATKLLGAARTAAGWKRPHFEYAGAPGSGFSAKELRAIAMQDFLARGPETSSHGWLDFGADDLGLSVEDFHAEHPLEEFQERAAELERERAELELEWRAWRAEQDAAIAHERARLEALAQWEAQLASGQPPPGWASTPASSSAAGAAAPSIDTLTGGQGAPLILRDDTNETDVAGSDEGASAARPLLLLAALVALALLVGLRA